MSDLSEKIDSVLVDIQNQATLLLFDRTQASAGMFFKVGRSGELVHCEVCTSDLMTIYGRFVVSPNMVIDEQGRRIELKIRVNATLAESFKEAEVYYKALTIVMDVARLIEKTYCQTWRVQCP